MNSGIVYDTSATALPALDVSLRGIPSGTYSGTWTGGVRMTGELTGDVVLSIAFNGRIEPVMAGSNQIRRVPGSTTITGTVVLQYGTYAINITR